MVLLYHTCYQNLPPVHKTDIEHLATLFHPKANHVLTQSDHVILYQEKRNLYGLATVKLSLQEPSIMDLTMIGVAQCKQKQGIGTEILTYVVDELQAQNLLRVVIPKRYNFPQLRSFFEKRDFSMVSCDDTEATFVRNP